jgi:hypothetical protein
MAGLGIGRGAGGARADGDIAHRHHQGFAVHVSETEVEIPRQSLGGMAVQLDIGDTQGDLRVQPVTQIQQPTRLFRLLPNGQLDGRT